MTTMSGLPLSTDGLITRSVEDWIKTINYGPEPDYIPSTFALEFVNFIKLVNDGKGEEHETPVVHYHMLDQIPGNKQNIANMCSRGLAKSALLAEYLFLYIAVYGEIPGFGTITYALYVSDSIENGVKKMRLRIENRILNSEFLQQYISETRFTDIRWAFTNASGKKLVITAHGAKTGVRGTVELNTRPQLAILDDLISDDDARSSTVIASVEDTVYKAVDYALHPTKNKIIWSGTPFNARDPLYKAIESGAWYVNVYPVCEKFPCTREEFKGAWEERFTYDYVKSKYDKALKAGKLNTFNQELMLRIMSEEDRLILDTDIMWYKHASVLSNRGRFNFYITTDFATTEDTAGDFSVISVWAYSSNGDWFWVDGIVKKQLMNQNIDDLFRLCQEYNPILTGIEVSGQQGGFTSWIMDEQLRRNIYFTIASEGNNNKPGIRPNTNKMQRFNIVVPWFKSHKIYFPEEMKESPEVVEAVTELSLASPGEFKSKYDDFIDTISQLASLKVYRPSPEAILRKLIGGSAASDVWEIEEDPIMNRISSYIV